MTSLDLDISLDDWGEFDTGSNIINVRRDMLGDVVSGVLVRKHGPGFWEKEFLLVASDTNTRTVHVFMFIELRKQKALSFFNCHIDGDPSFVI
jgi:hypothetical protein